MNDTREFIKRSLAILIGLALIIFAVWLAGCKVLIPVDETGQPAGQASIEPSESGEMEAVTVDPSGTETPVDFDVEGPSADEIGGAIGAAASTLPPPWNLLGLLGGIVPLIGKKKK